MGRITRSRLLPDASHGQRLVSLFCCAAVAFAAHVSPVSAEASPNSASGLQAQSALSGDPIRKVDAPLLPHRTVVVVVKPLDLSALAPGAFGDWDQVSNAIPATLPR